MPHRDDGTHTPRAALGRSRVPARPGRDRTGRPGVLLALALAAALAAAVAGAVLPHGLLLAAGLIAAAVAVIRSGEAGRDRERLP
ncbi:hypothetical protein [Streptomyces erythrochromogenes]|uniref:hypothetical protein n=1 Tax=Streptomyces erythrochromogenes TaxID=285574 RepID=UPI0038700674|nr:hypothetical protein OG489_03065 [Streptomyces erythrochromogenes]